MSRCRHRTVVFVPHEDDPAIMVQLCVNCSEVLGVAMPYDGEIEDIGDSLGDPSEEG